MNAATQPALTDSYAALTIDTPVVTKLGDHTSAQGTVVVRATIDGWDFTSTYTFDVSELGDDPHMTLRDSNGLHIYHCGGFSYTDATTETILTPDQVEASTDANWVAFLADLAGTILAGCDQLPEVYS